MLIVKAHRVAFDLMSGRKVTAAPTYGMLHDPSGEDWPKDSVLVMRYTRSGRAIKSDGAMASYLGGDYQARSGEADLPSRSLEGWKKLGDVKTIYYVRTGKRAPGGFYHHFGKGAALEHKIFRGEGDKPVLYRKGKTLRLELPAGSTLNWRGFVWP